MVLTESLSVFLLLGKYCIIDGIALDICMHCIHHIISNISFFWSAGCANYPGINQADILFVWSLALATLQAGFHPSNNRQQNDGYNSLQGNISPNHAIVGNLWKSLKRNNGNTHTGGSCKTSPWNRIDIPPCNVLLENPVTAADNFVAKRRSRHAGLFLFRHSSSTYHIHCLFTSISS